jgi:hypothetical protein
MIRFIVAKLLCFSPSRATGFGPYINNEGESTPRTASKDNREEWRKRLRPTKLRHFSPKHQKLARRCNWILRAGSWFVEWPKSPFDISEVTPVRLTRLNRLMISPFASILIFSPKNQGVSKNFSHVKSTLL